MAANFQKLEVQIPTKMQMLEGQVNSLESECTQHSITKPRCRNVAFLVVVSNQHLYIKHSTILEQLVEMINKPQTNLQNDHKQIMALIHNLEVVSLDLRVETIL